MDRKAVLAITLTLMLTSMLTFALNIQPVKASETVVSVYPPRSKALVGETFNVTVNVFNVTNLYGFEFCLLYDTIILDGLSVELPPGHFLTPVDPTKFFIAALEIDDAWNATHGRVLAVVLLLAPEQPRNGSGTLVTITFKATAQGECDLDLGRMTVKLTPYGPVLVFVSDKVALSDIDGNPIEHEAADGYFDNRAFTAVVDVNPNALNLRSKGKWVTAYIELPEDYGVEDIDVSTILLNDEVPAENSKVCGRKLNVGFNRSEVIALLSEVGEVELTVTGKLFDGTPFEARDTIRIR